MTNTTESDKRRQILCAAEDLIAKCGFQGLSMQKLAQKARVAAGTIYRYFDDKEHFLNELRLHVSQRAADAVQANLSSDMPLKEQYRTMWLNVWRVASTDINVIMNHLQYESLPTTNSSNIREMERRMYAQVDQLFDQGKALGIFKPLDNVILSCLSLGASVTLARKHSLGIYQLDDAELDSAIKASWDAIIKH